MAIDEINTNATANVSNGKKEKVKIYTSYTRLTNRLPNELTITGILEKDTEDCALYENPVVYFEFPAEIEKVVVNDIKVLYDNELKLKDYTIEKNDVGNQVIKVSLEGKQTQYSTDGISQGTNIRIVANVIAKQDIKTGYEDLTMVCNTATAEQGLLIVNATENAILNNVEPKKENGTIIYANGLMLNTRSSIGSNTLKDGDTIHSNEIINNQITITNPIENIKVLGYIPEGMTFVKYDEEAFGYWEDTYTFLTDDPETSDGSILWQDDDWQYPADETVKTKEFTIETLKSGESQTFNYETKVNKIDKEKELETKIEFQIKDKDATEYRNISTYTIKNNAKDAAFETRIRTYIDRGDNSETGSSKNNWVYNVIVKNISNETQNATVKINVPETLSIKNVEKIVDKGEEFSYKLENGVLTVNYEGIAANDYRAFGIEAEAVNVITDENCRYQIEYSATVEDSNKDITSSNLSVSKGGIPAVKITQTSETNGETLNGHDEIEYKFEIENIGYVREEDGGYSEYVFVTNIPKELEVTSITYNSNEVTKETIDSRTVYTIKPIDKYYTSDDLARINADDYLDEIRAKEVIILKNEIMENKEFNLFVETISLEDMNDFRGYVVNEHLLYLEHPDFYKDYIPAQYKPKEKSSTTIINTMNLFCVFLHWCKKMGYTSNEVFLQYGCKVPVYGVPFYLSIEERNILYEADLSSTPLLEVIRDIFVFHCYIGCRVGDLYRLTRENIKDGFVEYMPQRTKKCEAKTVRVPLHEKALRILSKYENSDTDKLFPFKPVYTYNSGIRELLKQCGIDRMVTVLDTHGYKTVQKPLYEVASSHTARKTFVGNLYKQVPDPNLIASMSGHVEGSRAFARYRNIDDDMKRKLVDMIN